MRGSAPSERQTAAPALGFHHHGDLQAARLLGHAADRQPAPRQLSRRHGELGRHAGDSRLHLLRRRHARDHRCWQDPTALQTARSARSPPPTSPPASTRSSSILFNQSQVHEHAELAWVFNCVARIGWMNRMTQFKDKAGKDRENASLGLYAYPTPDGRRHPDLPRNPRAGRRGPEAASRTDPRHRHEVQQRLRQAHRRARAWRRLLPRSPSR